MRSSGIYMEVPLILQCHSVHVTELHVSTMRPLEAFATQHDRCFLSNLNRALSMLSSSQCSDHMPSLDRSGLSASAVGDGLLTESFASTVSAAFWLLRARSAERENCERLVPA